MSTVFDGFDLNVNIQLVSDSLKPCQSSNVQVPKDTICSSWELTHDVRNAYRTHTCLLEPVRDFDNLNVAVRYV